MPTGYTDGVYRGEITELKDFAAACARGFGVFIHQRDESSDATLRYPDFDSYYAEQGRKAVRAYVTWSDASEEDRYALWSEYVEDQMQEREATLRRDTVVRERYENMIAQVESVNAPDELKGFKEFMLEQLNSSLKSDTFSNVDSAYGVKSYPEWCDARSERLLHDINYYNEMDAEAHQRYNKSVKFIDDMAKTFGFEVERP